MNFIFGLILGLFIAWQLAKSYFGGGHQMKEGSINPCPHCGSEMICSGVGQEGAEWACLNPNCVSWSEFSYQKRKEGFSTQEISKLWKIHKQKYFE